MISNTGQLVTGMDLVDHDLHVQGLAALGIQVSWVVTGHEDLYLEPITAMAGELELAVAALATGCIDDVACFRKRGAIRYEVDVRVRGGAAMTTHHDRDAVGEAAIVADRRVTDRCDNAGEVGRENILILSISVVGEAAVALTVGLLGLEPIRIRVGGAANRFGTIVIRDPLVGALGTCWWDQLGDAEINASDADHGIACVILNAEIDHATPLASAVAVMLDTMTKTLQGSG